MTEPLMSPSPSTDTTLNSRNITDATACPCQSSIVYGDCCGRYHNGSAKQSAPDALALMRSRYSAYALGLADYILNTTHRENKQFRRNLKAWRLEVTDYCQRTQFLGLKILDNAMLNEQVATVTFQAMLLQDEKPYQLNEKSLFYKVGARWLYYSGRYDEGEGDVEPRTTNGETDAFPRQDG
jgi:SEC-C motif domain protein